MIKVENFLTKITVKFNEEPSPDVPRLLYDHIRIEGEIEGEIERLRRNIIKNIKREYKGLLSKKHIKIICAAVLSGNYVSIHIENK